MAEIETLGILDEVQSIVSDNLQVVSYKWLSRKFLVSSNAAKRLLQEFVEKYGDGLEVIYSLSGWLKSNPLTYHIRLVSKDKLSVYSVQACLPKDSATLWNHEFIQAEDLFKQPLSVDNCLQDNRFCGVSNSFVKRAAPLGTGTVSGASTSYSARQTIPIPKPQQSVNSAKTVKIESHVKQDREQGGQLAANKEKDPQLPPNNKKGKTDKNSSGSGGGALASIAEAQICARESVEDGSSDEDGQEFNVKRASNGESSRKRRVVFDYSDEEDEYQDAVNLASPDPPKKTTPCLKDGSSAFGLECKLSFEKEIKPETKEVKKEDDVKANQDSGEKVLGSGLNIGKKTESITSDKTPITEVVWEGEEPDAKSENNNAAKVAENNTANNAINRPPVVRKSPAVTTGQSNQAGKAGNKKAGNKDPKQGNIMSFFKKDSGVSISHFNKFYGSNVCVVSRINLLLFRWSMGLNGAIMRNHSSINITSVATQTRKKKKDHLLIPEILRLGIFYQVFRLAQDILW
ncbi:DNA polymerase delta subunit 3 [Phtheirospermum japonicum]|uniref:DNA polymerase delta subunit 3 n=1 Tax=Phtheirospermum japonicum TaxID=374723 RepID=A0A830BSN4_9LAMI|nr:DNA polymerase delta subunit 3 [Phtheirospermum japonicum]